tara:strand:- start:22 stop:1296 length:1275 start_codon:yes stop_codon:yes gene_type:complete
MKVLSLFDGMSCGRIALDQLGIPVEKYYASEIDKYAMQVSAANYPDIEQVGDICNLDPKDYKDVDLMLAGSPCQGFSFAGKQLAFDDPRSALFFEFIRLLKAIKPKYFLLENVRMKKEFLQVISQQVSECYPEIPFGIEPIFINSSLVSAQSRQRYYWTNIPGIKQPEDRGIVLRDILETEDLQKYNLSKKANKRAKNNLRSRAFKPNQKKSGALLANQYKQSTDSLYALVETKPKQVGVAVDINGHDVLKRVYSPEGKSPTVNTCQGGNREPKVVTGGAFRGRAYDKDGKRKDRDGSSVAKQTKQMLELRKDNKSNAITTVGKDSVVVKKLPDKSQTIKSQYYKSSRANFERQGTFHATGVHQEDLTWRKLTPLECERLQTVPDNYTNHVSNTQRYKMLGNGWTVEVIKHILQEMEYENDSKS